MFVVSTTKDQAAFTHRKNWCRDSWRWGRRNCSRKETGTKLRVSSALQKSWRSISRKDKGDPGVFYPCLCGSLTCYQSLLPFLHGKLLVFQAPAKFSRSCLLSTRHNVTDCRAPSLPSMALANSSGVTEKTCPAAIHPFQKIPYVLQSYLKWH